MHYRKSRKGGVSSRRILLRFPIINRTTGIRITNVEERVPPAVMDGGIDEIGGIERFLIDLIVGIPGVEILGRMELNRDLDVYELELNVTRTQVEIRDWIQGGPILHQVFVYQGVRYRLGNPTIVPN